MALKTLFPAFRAPNQPQQQVDHLPKGYECAHLRRRTERHAHLNQMTQRIVAVASDGRWKAAAGLHRISAPGQRTVGVVRLGLN